MLPLVADAAVGIGAWGIPLAIVAGAIRDSTPFLFVSLGETLTERSGRINLGQEGTLVMGAMAGFAVSYLTSQYFPSVGSWLGPWMGVIFAGLAASVLGLIHALLCSQPRVNDIAVGIGIMLFGVGLAFYLGKPFVQPMAPQLPAISFGFWSSSPQVRANLQINWLFFVGVALAPIMAWALKNTRWGLIVRTAGESVDSARAMGYSVNAVRMWATVIGAFLAGVGGSFLSLYYPGSWNEGLSSGQGLMAVALVIFARWKPVNCLFAALLFGGAKAIGPALQSVGISKGHYLVDAAPYILTLLIMIFTCSSTRSLAGAPEELGRATA
ncbi:MAG TPA: ABC transporter permease [Tepidisphaeraceae bacterium]|nr:ABC transporter permease [Tepidisphaeraceae bacterium]